MIMTIVESGGADKLPQGSSVAVYAMLVYVAAASVAAGLGSVGSGLLVLAMGALTVAVVDLVMWRDVVARSEGAGLGGYVLAGREEPLAPHSPAAIHAFEAIRREAPAAPAPASPPPVGIAAANDAGPPAAASAETSPEARADAVGARPPGLDAPRGGTPDDLEAIAGIGPGNRAKLNALGIWHLDQIAAWDEAQIRWVGAYLAFPGRIEREDWVGQARALAASRAPA